MFDFIERKSNSCYANLYQEKRKNRRRNRRDKICKCTLTIFSLIKAWPLKFLHISHSIPR